MATDASNATWLRPFDTVRRAVADDGLWRDILGAPGAPLPTCGLHLAVFVEPFLGYVLDGSKTVESRFATTRQAPYRRVTPGDVMLLKRTSGPVVGLCRVRQAWFYRLDPVSWKVIREQFARALCAQDPAFWAARQSASFATLLQVRDVKRIAPVAWPKRSRQGWVVLSSGPDPNGVLWS
jgi:hypothetical protein